jgi:hypothetical protein
MPSGDPDDTGDDAPAAVSGWKRFTGAVSNFALKPAVAAESGTGNATSELDRLTDLDDIEAAVKRSNDKERLVGLLVSPVAAAIGFLVTTALVANDPKLPSPHHVNPNQYAEFGLLSMALSLVMLGTAWFRKRTFFGIASALYGLSLFNLHYWGFGVPYILIGSWFLVRAYRLQEKLKVAKAGDTESPRNAVRRTSGPNKRYTPPTAPPARSPKPKPGKGIETGLRPHPRRRCLTLVDRGLGNVSAGTFLPPTPAVK